MLLTQDGQTVEVTEAARAATLRFTAAVPPADRAWVLGAIAAARPEAQALLGEIDGMTTIGALTARDGVTLGVAQGGPSGFTVDLDLAGLAGVARTDRATVVLHELGHVVDFALVDDPTLAALDAQIPRGGPCGLAVGCDDPAERFADTFAKWALRGAVSAAGAGYGIAMPASLETWGEPLGAPRAHPAEVGCGAVRNAEAERFVREVWAVFQRDGVPGVLELGLARRPLAPALGARAPLRVHGGVPRRSSSG